MNIDITPGIEIAAMGGLGYLFGVVAKTDPKMTALVWLVAETAVQIFRKIKPLERYELENSFRSVAAGAACYYLADRHLLTKAIHVIISMGAFCIVPDMMRRLYREIGVTVK